MLQISGKMAVITSVSVAMQSAPPVPNTNCTDCPIVTNWLQHKNPCRHICPTCAPLFFCSKIRKIQRYDVFLRKVGLYSGAGLVFVENRAEGILWVQQQARVKLIKSCSPPSRLWSSLLACLPPSQMVNAILTMSIQVYVQLKFY